MLMNASYQALYKVNSLAQWDAMRDVTPEHDAAAEAASRAYAAFNGNPAVIKEARELLTHKGDLNPLTVRELEQDSSQCCGRADDESVPHRAPASNPRRGRPRS